MSHKHAIGQGVHYASPIVNQGAPSAYRIVELLQIDNDAGRRKRIRNLDENFEQVAKEEQPSRAT